MQFSLLKESNNLKFDQIYIKILIFMIKISIIELIIKYISVVNLVGVTNINTIF
jgi:hypothetical protein